MRTNKDGSPDKRYKEQSGDGFSASFYVWPENAEWARKKQGLRVLSRELNLIIREYKRVEAREDNDLMEQRRLQREKERRRYAAKKRS